MLTREELNQIEQLKTDNPRLWHLFHKIEQEHRCILLHFSHNIRNDLTLLSSSLQLMEKQHPLIRTFKYWTHCINSVTYICDFLEQFSDYNNGSKLTYVLFNLDRLLSKLVYSIQYEPHFVPTSVILQTKNSCPEICGDPIKLYHAIELLLENSFEAISEEHNTIIINLSHYHSFCKISISDKSNNFADKMEQRLWNPFCVDGKKHTGLELCTANRIILAHSGSIRLAHASSGESVLEIWLPLPSSRKCKQLVQQTN